MQGLLVALLQHTSASRSGAVVGRAGCAPRRVLAGGKACSLPCPRRGSVVVLRMTERRQRRTPQLARFGRLLSEGGPGVGGAHDSGAACWFAPSP